MKDIFTAQSRICTGRKLSPSLPSLLFPLLPFSYVIFILPPKMRLRALSLMGRDGRDFAGAKKPNEMHHHRLHVNERPPPPLGSCLKTKCVHAAAVTFLEKFEKLSSISSPPQIFWTVGDVNERRGERSLSPSCFFFRARTLPLGDPPSKPHPRSLVR